MTTADITTDTLVALAKARRSRVKHWWGIRGGATQKHAECYLCDSWIDTWAARWPMPKHAAEAIEAHRQAHLAEQSPVLNARLQGTPTA